MNISEQSHWSSYFEKIKNKPVNPTIIVGIAGNQGIAEGEGDLSLEYWRKAHIDFFNPYLEEWDVKDLNKDTLITEFSEVVYK